MFAQDFASAVKRARTRLGLTQQALALACGLSRQTVAQVEAGTFSDLGVRKVERMLAALELSLAVSGAATDAQAPAIVWAGSPNARSRLSRLLADRAAARRQRALELARRTLSALRKQGVSVCVVGSLAKGRFRADSDVDYLIEDRGGVPESRVIAIVEAAMKGFPFDVTFAGRADPRLLAMMREEARHGASAVRPA